MAVPCVFCRLENRRPSQWTTNEFRLEMGDKWSTITRYECFAFECKSKFYSGKNSLEHSLDIRIRKNEEKKSRYVQTFLSSARCESSLWNEEIANEKKLIAVKMLIKIECSRKKCFVYIHRRSDARCAFVFTRLCWLTDCDKNECVTTVRCGQQTDTHARTITARK